MAIFDTTRRNCLRTKRLYLRAAQEGDLDDLFEMFKDEEVMRFWSSPPHTHKSQTKRYLQNMINSEVNGILDFAIVLASTHRSAGKVIGKAGIWDPDNHEIGFMLHRDYWGRGYMSEAITALLPYLWEQGVERIVADVDPRNEGCRRLLGRFGFVETGMAEKTFQTAEGWCDSLYLALERPTRGLEVG